MSLVDGSGAVGSTAGGGTADELEGWGGARNALDIVPAERRATQLINHASPRDSPRLLVHVRSLPRARTEVQWRGGHVREPGELG